MKTVEYIEFKREPLFQPRWLSSVLLFVFAAVLGYLIDLCLNYAFGWGTNIWAYIIPTLLFAYMFLIIDNFGFVRIQNHETLKIFGLGGPIFRVESVPVSNIKELRFKQGRRLFLKETRIKIIAERKTYTVCVSETDEFTKLLLSINKNIVTRQ